MAGAHSVLGTCVASYIMFVLVHIIYQESSGMKHDWLNLCVVLCMTANHFSKNLFVCLFFVFVFFGTRAFEWCSLQCIHLSTLLIGQTILFFSQWKFVIFVPDLLHLLSVWIKSTLSFVDESHYPGNNHCRIFFQLLALGLPFGRVKNVLLLKAKKPHEPTQVGMLKSGCSLNYWSDTCYLLHCWKLTKWAKQIIVLMREVLIFGVKCNGKIIIRWLESCCVEHQPFIM